MLLAGVDLGRSEILGLRWRLTGRLDCLFEPRRTEKRLEGRLRHGGNHDFKLLKEILALTETWVALGTVTHLAEPWHSQAM